MFLGGASKSVAVRDPGPGCSELAGSRVRISEAGGGVAQRHHAQRLRAAAAIGKGGAAKRRARARRRDYLTRQRLKKVTICTIPPRYYHRNSPISSIQSATAGVHASRATALVSRQKNSLVLVRQASRYRGHTSSTRQVLVTW